MRILLTADPELPVPPTLYGGIERIVDQLARSLSSRGHCVGLVANRDSTCPVESFFAWPGLRSQNHADTIANMRALRRAAKAFRPDVIHSFSRILYLLPLLGTRTPRIMSYQREPGVSNVSRAHRWSRRGTMFLTGCSDYIRRQGARGGGDWSAIPNFVDLATYTPVVAVGSDAPLVFLSRIERIKGAHTAIAIARGSKRRLLIAGNHSTSGEAGDYWRTEIEPHLGRDGIEYVGPVDDVRKNALLGSAAAMLVPIEWNEPFGIVFAEALACGTPVISCPLGALPEIVESGVHGFLIDSVEEGVRAVADIARIDRRACRARASQLFASEVVVSQYEGLYARAVSSAAAS